MDFVLTEDEQRFTDEVVARCSPSNAEQNPETAAVMAVLRPEIAEGLDALFARKQRLVASVAMAVTKVLAAEDIDRKEAADGLSQFLSALGNVDTDESPSPWEAIRATTAGGDSDLLEKFYSIDDPLFDSIKRAVIDGVSLIEVERVGRVAA